MEKDEAEGFNRIDGIELITGLHSEFIDFSFYDVLQTDFVNHMGKLFGTDGIRGKANEYPINVEMATKLGRAIASILPQGNPDSYVIVGRDTRQSGFMLEAALCAGLNSVGWNVLLTGVLPTPAVAQLVKDSEVQGGVMITASHNPFEDNGLKIFGPDGYKLPDEVEEKIEALLLSESFDPILALAENIGFTTPLGDAESRYVEAILSSVEGLDLSGKTVVLDCANGATSAVAGGVFEQLGAKVVTTAVEPIGTNINEGCGALYPEKAGELVQDYDADLGISFDGDGDRVIFCDEKGQPINGDRVLGLGALALKKQDQLRGETLVCTVMSNLGLHEAMQKAGISVATTQVGDRHVLERMRAADFNFGGENSGHLIFSDYSTTGDGILSALQILKLMADSGKTLSELSEEIPLYPQKLTNLKIASKPDLTTLPKLNQVIAEANEAFAGQGRELIRYSGTENKIRILVEHKEEALVEEWTEKLVAVVKEEIGEV